MNKAKHLSIVKNDDQIAQFFKDKEFSPEELSEIIRLAQEYASNKILERMKEVDSWKVCINKSTKGVSSGKNNSQRGRGLSEKSIYYREIVMNLLKSNPLGVTRSQIKKATEGWACVDGYIYKLRDTGEIKMVHGKWVLV